MHRGARQAACRETPATRDARGTGLIRVAVQIRPIPRSPASKPTVHDFTQAQLRGSTLGMRAFHRMPTYWRCAHHTLSMRGLDAHRLHINTRPARDSALAIGPAQRWGRHGAHMPALPRMRGDRVSQPATKRNSALRAQHRARIAKGKPDCHICGKPIDYSLPHTDPKSFVADHVVPLAKGGPDTLMNKKAAHSDCNNAKRARAYAPIVRRSGSLG